MSATDWRWEGDWPETRATAEVPVNANPPEFPDNSAEPRCSASMHGAKGYCGFCAPSKEEWLKMAYGLPRGTVESSDPRDLVEPRLADTRDDGWPICPFCDEDELYSLDLPPTRESICGCYRCGQVHFATNDELIWIVKTRTS